MKLIVLGSGTSMPHPHRAAPAFWLQTLAGSILLDCGADAMHRMAAGHLDWANLDAIWISHLHLDHCGGLGPFLFGTKHARETQQRRKPLRIFGCEGLRQYLRTIEQASQRRLLEQPFPISLHEWAEVSDSQDQFEILDGLTAQTFPTPHTNESRALRITNREGLSVVYTADTGYSEDLAVFAKGAKLLVIECSFPRDKPVQKHLELADTMRLASMATPQAVLLVHLYGEWDGTDIENEASKLWGGKTIAAYDGLQLDIDS